MTLYLRLKVKDLLSNPELLGWSIGFVEFWVFMWLYVFSPARVEGPFSEYLTTVNASMAFSFLGLISMSAVAVGLAYSVLYSSRAARYLTKFTRASPATFMVEDFLASMAVALIVVGVIMASVLAGSYARWGVLPRIENPIGVFVDLVLAGVAMYWLAYAVALSIVVTRRTGAMSMASFVPLILAFIAYAELWVDFGWLVYVVPLCTIPALLVYHSTGAIPPTGAYLKWLSTRELMPAVDLRLAALSLFAWIAVFAASSLALLRRSRGVPLEELRY